MHLLCFLHLSGYRSVSVTFERGGCVSFFATLENGNIWRHSKGVEGILFYKHRVRKADAIQDFTDW